MKELSNHPKAIKSREWRKNHPHYWRERFQKLREQFGGKCVVCGETEKLEFAHIKPTELEGLGRGQKERYYDILRHPKSYVLMTKHCHREFDKISPELKEEWLQKNARFINDY